MKTLLLSTIIALPGLLVSDAYGQWIQPYPNGSADDHLIRFNQGPTGSVTAPDPIHLPGYSYNLIPAVGAASGWSLVASGSVGVGDFFSFDGKSNAFARAGGENLRFGADTEHRNQLTDAFLPMTWIGQATIPGSVAWVTATNHFRYNFDIALDNQLVDDFPSIFDSFNLTITAGANVLYSGVGLRDILDVAVIDQNMYHDVFVSFDYDQSDGPLTITWSGSALITGAILDSLGNGPMDIMRVHKPWITTEAIPEPSSIALLASLAVTATAFSRKRRR